MTDKELLERLEEEKKIADMLANQFAVSAHAEKREYHEERSRFLSELLERLKLLI